MMTIGIHANLGKPEVREILPDLVDWLNARQVRTVICGDLGSHMPLDPEKIETISQSEFCLRSDLVIVLGGDGTMLAAARLLGQHAKPLLGINLGRLGFLTATSPSNMYPFLESVIRNEYQVEKRMILDVAVAEKGEESSYFALNEVVVDRGGISRLIRIHVHVNGEPFNIYDADGIIVATPTGSTAYSLASGGPIVHPALDSILLTPVCPHSLSERPTILPPDSKISIRVPSTEPEASLSIDGQITVAMNPETEVRIRKGSHHIHIVTLPDRSFYDVLRKKLGWGSRIRE